MATKNTKTEGNYKKVKKLILVVVSFSYHYIARKDAFQRFGIIAGF